jgi:glycine betaine/proline transport system ATP-binding protein
MPMVEFRNVDVVFGRDPAAALKLLDAGETRETILAQTGMVLGAAAANIAVEEGEICVLMGLSGSGKSTLLRCVNGLNTASRGNVLVRDGDTDVDIPKTSAKTLRRLRTERIAMVFQQFALLPWRTVRENVGFGLEIRGIAANRRREIVDRQLELVHLEQWADKYAHELSGGMQQRVGLARAFATDADILLMDEPFSALDPLIRERLQEELLELQRTLNKTIVFVSHDLDEALKLGNRVAIMEGGKIVQQGPPQEIVLKPSDNYVAQFVANINPMRVLTAESVMTPLEDLPRNADIVHLDENRGLWLEVLRSGVQVTEGNSGVVPLAPVSGTSSTEQLTSQDMALVGLDTGINELIRARLQTQRPALVVEAGKPVGVVGDKELYSGLTGVGSATHS